jgi:large subunit ribosomal protein L5
MSNLKEQYYNKIRKDIKKELKLDNIYAVPNLSKIVINSGVSSAVSNPDSLNDVKDIMIAISGQLPLVTKARESISNFHLREGMNIGLMVTLRNDRMWDFYEKLVEIVIPRFRDFRGLKKSSFDKNGNYNLGIPDHSVFPEVVQIHLDKVKSLQVTIVTTAKNKEDAIVLFNHLGFPLEK